MSLTFNLFRGVFFMLALGRILWFNCVIFGNFKPSMCLNACIANELGTIDTIAWRWIIIVSALCNLFGWTWRTSTSTRSIISLYRTQQFNQEVIIDDEIRSIFHFTHRTHHHRHIAALIVWGEDFLLLLHKALFAAAMKAFQQLGTIIYCEVLLTPTALSWYFQVLIRCLLIINLECKE